MQVAGISIRFLKFYELPKIFYGFLYIRFQTSMINISYHKNAMIENNMVKMLCNQKKNIKVFFDILSILVSSTIKWQLFSSI